VPALNHEASAIRDVDRVTEAVHPGGRREVSELGDRMKLVAPPARAVIRRLTSAAAAPSRGCSRHGETALKSRALFSVKQIW
jgi:hypothetical protein